MRPVRFDRRFLAEILGIVGLVLAVIVILLPHLAPGLEGAASALLLWGALMFGGLVWSLGRSRTRAEALAREMTSDLVFAKEQAESALRETEALRKTLDEHAIVSVADAKGRITAINDTFCRISGYSRDELIGQDHRILNSGHHPRDFWVEMWKTISSGRAWHGEVCNRAKDGSLYWVDSIIAPFKGADGKIEKYVSIRSDISERKRAEQELRHVIQIQDEMGQVAGVGGWELDPITGKVTWTKEIYRIFEVPYSFANTVEAGLSFFPEESRRLVADHIERAVATGEPFDYTVPFRSAKGRDLWVRGRGKAERRADGTMRLYGAFQDVTETHQKKAELVKARDIAQRALRETEALRHTIDKHAIVSVADPSGRIIDANDAFCRISGYSRDELLGQDHRILNSGHHPKRYWAKMWHTVSSGEAWHGEVCNRAKDGTIYWEDSIIAPFIGSHGQIEKYVSIRTNITERKRAEQALLERTSLATLEAEVGTSLTRAGTLAEMLQQCCETITRHLDTAFTRIWTLNERENVLELQASAGQYTHLDGAHSRVPVGKFKIGLIAEERLPHLTNQVVGDSRVGDQDWAQREGMVAFAGYPLILENRLVGVVAMFARHELSELTLQALGSIANYIAGAIERKRSEQALQESEARLRGNFELGLIGMAITSSSKGFIDVNAKICEILGYERNELFQKTWAELTHEDDLDVDIAKFNRMLAGELDAYSMPKRFIRKDGRIIHTVISVKCHRKTDGSVDYLVAGMEDVTERTLAERALHESEQRFRMIADTIPQLLWTTAPDGNAVYCNARWHEYSGLSIEQTRGWGWKTAMHPDDAPIVLETWGRCLQTGEAYGVECRFKRGSDGAYRWFLIRGVAVRDPSGAIVQWIGACTDIDDQKRAAETEAARIEAENANRAKSEFLATMSHELRTPLNGVIGMAELLMSTNLDAKQRRYAWLAKSSGDALLALINDILDFSKIEAGKIELEHADFDLCYSVECVTASFASRAEGKGLELVVGVHPKVPALVRGDPGRLQQILTNLIGNAIKFTEFGHVVVRAALERENERHADVCFTVQDSGIGISPDRLSRLFETFSQVDSSTTRRYGGTGLGLVISKRLVELMGGRIGVVSEECKGSTFWFTVPLEKQVSDGSEIRAVCEEVRNLRVLVVDDNEISREILHEQLTGWGMEHEVVPGGPEALAALRAAAAEDKKFGLAIVDMRMPGMNGWELAKAVKADSALQETILVLIAPAHDEPDAEHLHAGGFAGYASKPVRPSQLLDTITDSLNSSKAPTAQVSVTTAVTATRRIKQTPVALTDARILLAEDHPISQEVAATILRQAGYQCDVVGNGKEALDAVTRQRYDLVLMDCQMPQMDGFTATRAIRQSENERRVAGPREGRLCIVALTANAIKGDRERCLEAGMDDYLSKPLNPEKLIQLIEHNLSRAVEPTEKPSTPRTGSSISEMDGPADVGIPPFNMEFLLKQWGGDQTLVEKLIAKFRTQAQSDLEKLEQNIASGDWEEATRLAHGFKGAAGYLAAEKLSHVAAALETQCRNKDSANIDAGAASFCAELNRWMAYSLKMKAPGADAPANSETNSEYLDSRR